MQYFEKPQCLPCCGSVHTISRMQDVKKIPATEAATRVDTVVATEVPAEVATRITTGAVTEAATQLSTKTGADALGCSNNTRYGLAFSGGCDSTYLLAALSREGIDVKAYYVKSAFQAEFELEDALQAAQQEGAEFELIDVDIFVHSEVCENPPDRCYWCKRVIFGAVLERMKRDGRTVLLDGTNATDNPARRPGFRALAELGVKSPLRNAGLSKEDVRSRSRAMGLFTADKPNFSCFATKVPAGKRIDEAALKKAAAEHELRWR